MALAIVPALMVSGCATYQAGPILPEQLGAIEPLPASSAVRTYNYYQLLDLALQRSPTIRSEAENLKATRQDAKAARLLPPIGLTLGAEYSKDADAHTPWQFSAAGDLPLDVGARHGARVTSADLAVLVARNKLAEAIWSVRSKLVNALIDRSDGTRSVAEYTRLVAEAQRRYDVCQARLRLGEDAGDVSAAAQLDLVRAQRSLREALTRRDQSNATLAAILHIPVEMAASLDVAYNAGNPSLGTIDDRQARALFARSDVIDAITAYDQTEAELRLQVARQYPELRVGPGYTWERGVVKLPLDLTLTLPTLDRNAANIAAAENRRAAAGAALESAVRRAQAEIVQARIDYLAALDRSVKAHDVLAGAMARQTRRANANLSIGETDRPDQLLAEMAETNVAIEASAADGDVARSRAKLEDGWRQSADDTENAQLSTYLNALETGS